MMSNSSLTCLKNSAPTPETPSADAGDDAPDSDGDDETSAPSATAGPAAPRTKSNPPPSDASPQTSQPIS